MSTKIFYFTGTGNSLWVAENIADGLDDSELISIPIAKKKDLEGTSTVGFVFPVYMWGMPNMVADFVENLNLTKNQYIFAVITCAGQPGETLIQLQKILQNKGIDLGAGFVVKEEANTIQKDNIFIKTAMLIERKERFQSSKQRISEIIAIIKNKEQHPPETSSKLLNIYGNAVYGMAMPRINTMGRFFTDENCNLCLNCQKICPSDNIQVINEKPVWNHKCEFCQACIQWCPHEAIHIKNEDLTRRYHHPEIKLKDLILR